MRVKQKLNECGSSGSDVQGEDKKITSLIK